ncbi:MAG: translocation protein TolB [Deltaproteobacteria bacterium]|jgi:TolB protein|nr:translocation protein TolB [Deltaproteobacteria bacterium]
MPEFSVFKGNSIPKSLPRALRGRALRRLPPCLLLSAALGLAFAAGLRAAEIQVPAFRPGPQTQLNAPYLAPVTPVAYSVNLAVADPLGESSRKAPLQNAILHNLSFLPFIRLADPEAIPGGTLLPAASGPEMDLERFRLAGMDNLITSVWLNPYQVEIRAYEVESGRFMFGSRLDAAENGRIEDVADEFCAQFMETLTGRGDFFRASLAFVRSSGPAKRDIWVTRPTGRDLRQITNVPGNAISPAWSRDGRFIIFSHIDSQSHALGIWDSANGRMQRIRFPGNTVIGPCFTPDNKVIVGLSDGYNPGIFLLDRSFNRERKLISSRGIDVSPSVDASGSKIVFTSSRLGNPHIFMEDLKTGTTTRISFEGKYNTDPSISPDGTLVAFSRQMGDVHRIFVHDLRTGLEQQITFGPGSDEQPEFAPDSYFIAFTSTRSGQKEIYLTTRHGSEAKKVPVGRGDASFPSWGLPETERSRITPAGAPPLTN